MQAVCLCVCVRVRVAGKLTRPRIIWLCSRSPKGAEGHVVGATVNESSEAVCPLARAGRQAAEQPATW